MPAVIPGPSAAVNAALNTLKLQLPTILTAIWNDYSSIQVEFGNQMLTVTQPTNSILFLRHHHLVIPSYPAVMVYSISGDEYQDAAPQWGSWRHRLMVESWLIGENEEYVQEQLLRYVEGIWLCFERFQNLDGTLSGPHGVEATHYDILAKPSVNGKMVVGCRMNVAVLVDEGIQ